LTVRRWPNGFDSVPAEGLVGNTGDMTSLQPGGPQLAELAGLLADTTRATLCLALLDERAWTAGELARYAGVAASTVSEHLTRLVAGGLLVQERQGRHRYVRLAGPHVAELLEHMVAHAAPARPPASTLRAVTVASNLAYARTCYDHLAGRLGVVLTDAMIRNGVVDDTAGFSITAPGIAWLDGLGVDTAALRAGRRPMARACLDWTERRPHLAGAVGAILCRQLLARGWLTRISGQRAVRVTAVGRSGLAELFALSPVQLGA
jgi:DNA-binding transcriptional ArsR family regulator